MSKLLQKLVTNRFRQVVGVFTSTPQLEVAVYRSVHATFVFDTWSVRGTEGFFVAPSATKSGRPCGVTSASSSL